MKHGFVFYETKNRLIALPNVTSIQRNDKIMSIDGYKNIGGNQEKTSRIPLKISGRIDIFPEIIMATLIILSS